MKKIQNKLRMMVNALLTTILGWLAVSCHQLAPMYGPLVELYAPPAPRDLLQIKGQVTNKENESLESMQVSCHIKYGKEWVDIADAEYTNKEGCFDIYTDDIWEYHFHKNLEFVYVLQGAIDCIVNDKNCFFRAK